MGRATVILDSGFWKRGRINVVADVRFCMYVAGGCGVVDVLWCRERDITTLPCHVGFGGCVRKRLWKAPPRTEERARCHANIQRIQGSKGWQDCDCV